MIIDLVLDEIYESYQAQERQEFIEVTIQKRLSAEKGR